MRDIKRAGTVAASTRPGCGPPESGTVGERSALSVWTRKQLLQSSNERRQIVFGGYQKASDFADTG
jgi:hypothetical protein